MKGLFTEGYKKMLNIDSKNVFLDTNVLVDILDNPLYMANLEYVENIKKQHNVKFYTFEKCIYEYFNGYKKLLLDKGFLINSLKNNLKNNNEMEVRAQKIVIQSACSKHYTTADIMNALRVYSDVKGRRKWTYAVTQHYRNEDEYIEKMKMYVEDFDVEHLDSDTILIFFYHNINANFYTFRRSIENIVHKHIAVILYEQVFDTVKTQEKFRGIVEHALINPRDLESVMAAISSSCGLYLTGDEDLVAESISLGDNHITTFMHIQVSQNDSLVSKIKEAVENYLLSQ